MDIDLLDVEIIDYQKQPFDLNKYRKDLIDLDRQFNKVFWQTWPNNRWNLEIATVSRFAKFENRIIGEAFCQTFEDCEDLLQDEEYGHWKDLIHQYRTFKVAYLYSLTILPDFQGNSIGHLLMDCILQGCKDYGHQMMISHAKLGASAALHEKHGGILMDTRENWYGSGDTHNFYEFVLFGA